MFKKVLIACGVLFCSVHTMAAGYQLQEYSVTGLGRSFAGAGIIGDDYSALAYNPAGMQQRTCSGGQVGLTGIDVRTTLYGESSAPVTGAYSHSGHTFTRLFRLMPNAFGQYRLNDRAVFGVGLYAPYGLATDYHNDWYGNTHGLYSGITVADLTPAMSYHVMDSLTLGVGLNIQYAVAHLTGALPNMAILSNPSASISAGATDLRGDDYSLGYILGFVWQPQKSTKFGLSYRSHVDHKLQGHNKISGSTVPGVSDGKSDISAKITTPETIQFTVAQDVGKSWTLSGLARWTRWSRFADLVIDQAGASKPISLTHENWRDTWFLSLGADYHFCKNLTFRFGGAYDQSAVRNPAYRTPRIPDARRLWVSGGLSYARDHWQLDLGYAHLFIKHAFANGTAVDSATGKAQFKGNYDSKSDIAGIQFQYKF